MITLFTNLPTVLAPYIATLSEMQQGGSGSRAVLLAVAESVLEPLRTRIHEQGKAADGSDIGHGKGRALYKTGGLMNELQVIATSSGNYGLGWTDAEKQQRAEQLEQRYNKKIWSLSEDEITLATEAAEKTVSDAILK